MEMRALTEYEQYKVMSHYTFGNEFSWTGGQVSCFFRNPCYNIHLPIVSYSCNVNGLQPSLNVVFTLNHFLEGILSCFKTSVLILA